MTSSPSDEERILSVFPEGSLRSVLELTAGTELTRRRVQNVLAVLRLRGVVYSVPFCGWVRATPEESDRPR